MKRRAAVRLRARTGALSTIAVGMLVFGGSALGASASDRQHSLRHELEDTRARIAEARTREQRLAEDISAQSASIDSVEARLDRFGGELTALEERLRRARAELAALRVKLRETTAALAFARGQLAIARRRLEERVVAIYTSDEPELLELVLGADSLATLLDAIEMSERVLEQDTTLASDVAELRAQLERERRRVAGLERTQQRQTAGLDAHVRRQRAIIAAAARERERLADLRADRQQSLGSVRVQRREWEAEAAALAAESARVAAIAVAAQRTPLQSSSGGETPGTPPPSTSSGFSWPVSGSVVSPFGQRWGRLHAGIDIAAPAGTPIVASASGTVAYAGSMSGYGLIVVIQHDGGVATAYAHNSSISVAVGQSVGQGQTIAAVGCTGHCFGDHVHFEVRVGGSPVDPMQYL